MNCEKKNFFSGFFIALAIQVNQREDLVQEVICYVNFLKNFTNSISKFVNLFIKRLKFKKDDNFKI